MAPVTLVTPVTPVTLVTLVTVGLALLAACHGAPSPARPRASAAAAAPVLLVTLPDDPTAPPLQVAADARHLAWTSSAGIVLADADGTHPRVLVPDVFATALAIDGARLRFRTDEGTREGAFTVPLAGGRPGPDPRGPLPVAVPPSDADDDHDTALGSDTRGDVVVTAGGIVVRDRAGGLPRVHVPPTTDSTWVLTAPALLPEAIIVADEQRDGTMRLWRLARTAPEAPVLLATSDGEPRDLVAAAGTLHYLEAVEPPYTPDLPVTIVPARDHLVRVGADGRRTIVATLPSIITIAADARGVAFAAYDEEQRATIFVAEDGAAPRRVVDGIDDELVGLALSPRSLFWIAGGTIWTASRTGGRPTRFHQPDWGDRGGTGRVHLFIDGSSVYFSSVGLGATGIFRARGPLDATELWPAPDEGAGDELVQAGGALFVIVGKRALWRIPLDGTAARAIYTAADDAHDVELVTITAGGGWVYAAVRTDGRTEVLALDPATGAVASTLHTLDARALAADDTGVYIVLDDRGLIVRAPHPPHTPAVPAR